MLDKLYITPRQWMHILRWSLYSLLFLAAMMIQTVVLGNRTLLGAHPDLVPVVITCVCLREGPERGGLYALLCAVFWALSGADQGSVYILVLTVLPIGCSLLCRTVVANDYLYCLVACAVTLLVQHGLMFVLKYFYEAAAGSLVWTRLFPCVLVSLLTQPIFYGLVKCIEKIGEPYEST